MMIEIETAPAVANKPSGKLYLATDQLNLVHTVWTKVLLDTIHTDFTDGIEDTTNHRITPGVAGFYQVIGLVTFWNMTSLYRYLAAIKVNDTTWYSVNTSDAAQGTLKSVPVADLLKLTATDFVELFAMSVAPGDTVDIQAGSYVTFLALQRVR